MANPQCDRSTLFSTNPSFGLAGLDDNQFKAAVIYFLSNELSVIGGTDYTNQFTGTLVADATEFIGQADPNQFKIGLLQILYNNAVNAGATVSSDPSTINAATRCCLQSSPLMDAMILLLLCKLGYHADYPQ